MHKPSVMFLVFFSVLWCGFVFAAPLHRGPVGGDSWIVVFKNDVGVRRVQEIAAQFGLVAKTRVTTFANAFVLEAPPAEVSEFATQKIDPTATTAAISQLHTTPGVLHVEPNSLIQMELKTSVKTVNPNRNETCGIFWPDPLWGDQWHLCNDGKSGTLRADANVTGAWSLGYFGNGVQIAIVDDGVEHIHPDLAPRYVAACSYDFNGGDHDPSPGADNNHGTSCAGVALAASESTCGVGVAPQCSLAGIRLIAAGFRVSDEIQALSLARDQTHIFSNSWGPQDCGAQGCSLGQMNVLTKLQLQNNVRFGRKGLGNVYLWAGGNGGDIDNSNLDAYSASIYGIAVAACNDDGKQSYYSERGANIHVAAPSNDKNHQGITTTDKLGLSGYSEGNCTSSFGGTSSATPLVAGVVALMLEANTNLTWRDVKTILKESATKTDPTDSDWVQNGAGVWVNHKYGFGRVNAGRAVEMAVNWTPIPPMRSATYSWTGNEMLGRRKRSFTLNVPTTSRVSTVEMVEVSVWVTCIERGSIDIQLSSPSGTKSVLAMIRPDSGANYNGWTFMSVHHWGESSAGVWTLSFQDNSSPISRVTAWTLAIHGTALSSVEPDVCGDGIVGDTEQCDDGNTINGDGCDSSCFMEHGFMCDNAANASSSCHSLCGDGILVGEEECDDGNVADWDGCDVECKIDFGFVCELHPTRNFSLCYRKGSCNGTLVLREMNGRISDNSAPHDYGNNRLCTFVIAPPLAENEWIKLEFERFATESDYDFVSVYGTQETTASSLNFTQGELLGKFSGSSLPAALKSPRAHGLIVVFESDAGVVAKGFEAIYSVSSLPTSCANVTLTDVSGSFSDNSQGLGYEGTTCIWTISPSQPFSFVAVAFDFINLAEGDTISVHAGANTSEASCFAVFTGAVVPDIVHGPMMSDITVVFTAIGQTPPYHGGFNATYTVESGTPPMCALGSGLDGASGLVMDGSGEYTIAPRRECIWQITIPASFEFVGLTVNWLSLPDDAFLAILEPLGVGSSKLIAQYTGEIVKPVTIFSSSHVIYLLLKTSQYVGDGFELSWNAGSGAHVCWDGAVLTDSSGIITDGSEENNYPSSLTCSWLIQPDGNFDWIKLEFQSFATETDYDVLTVYDGASSDDAELLAASGAQLPRTTYTTQGNAMYITFQSDSTLSSEGFVATYTTGFGPVPVTQCEGELSLTELTGEFSSNTDSSYIPDQQCSFVIAPSFQTGVVNSVTLNFTSFQTELLKDTVRVYDGLTETDPLFGTFSGDLIFALKIGEKYFTTVPRFGSSKLPDEGVSGNFVLADPEYACSAFPAANFRGKIVGVQRGTCSFVEKLANVQNAGAAAMVVFNSASSLMVMGGEFPDNAIPAVLVSLSSASEILLLVDNQNTTTASLSHLLTSSQGKGMLVKFDSDSNDVAMSGFSARYTTNVTDTGPKVWRNCTSDSMVLGRAFGAFALSHTECSALIIPAVCGERGDVIDIQLTITDSAINNDNSGIEIELFDGPSQNHPILARYSSATLNFPATQHVTSYQAGAVWIAIRFSGPNPQRFAVNVLYAVHAAPTPYVRTSNDSLALFAGPGCGGNPVQLDDFVSHSLCTTNLTSASALVPLGVVYRIVEGCSNQGTVTRALQSPNSQPACLSLSSLPKSSFISQPITPNAGECSDGAELVFNLRGGKTVVSEGTCKIWISPACATVPFTINLSILSTTIFNGQVCIVDSSLNSREANRTCMSSQLRVLSVTLSHAALITINAPADTVNTTFLFAVGESNNTRDSSGDNGGNGNGGGGSSAVNVNVIMLSVALVVSAVVGLVLVALCWPKSWTKLSRPPSSTQRTRVEDDNLELARSDGGHKLDTSDHP